MPNPLRLCLLPALLAVSAPLASAQWTQPTPEELSMTSIPEVPGASAVYLFKEETQEDQLHMWSYYYRVKVLTEGGKDNANVELPYVAGSQGWTIDSIAGRTIQPDGTITAFTGKPYDKLIVNSGGRKVNAKVFTLPNVEVGSILEYRYKLRFDDAVYSQPEWLIQSDLYLRKGHYQWKPTTRELQNEFESGISSVAWTPILPPGPVVKQTMKGGSNVIELDVQNIKPVPHEAFMPPMGSISYRVMFYYTGYRTSDEYWKNAGKYWSNNRNKFMDAGSVTKAEVKDLIQPGDTDQQKVQKIYAFVETLDNTVFTRSHSSSEDRAQGFNKDVTSVDEVLKRKRGTDDQITEVFVSMLRVAGVKAYLMGVANREHRFFLPNYLSLSQCDDYIAIVPLNGKDEFFDPGQRYTNFGHLSWKHAYSAGLRQTEGGTAIFSTPSEGYKDAHISRIADLKLDEHGTATGTVSMTYTGDAALRWRQEALRGDDTSLNKELRSNMENILPGGMDVRVTKVDNLADNAQPLKVTFEVKGPVGSPTGKRLLIPANLFAANNKPRFTAATREVPVDMHYASYTQDAVRFTLPPGLIVESSPSESKEMFKNYASYNAFAKTSPTSITIYRNVINGKVMYMSDDYSGLKKFYATMEAKDGESLVLTRAAAAAPAASSAKASE